MEHPSEIRAMVGGTFALCVLLVAIAFNASRSNRPAPFIPSSVPTPSPVVQGMSTEIEDNVFISKNGSVSFTYPLNWFVVDTTESARTQASEQSWILTDSQPGTSDQAISAFFTLTQQKSPLLGEEVFVNDQPFIRRVTGDTVTLSAFHAGYTITITYRLQDTDVILPVISSLQFQQ